MTSPTDCRSSPGQRRHGVKRNFPPVRCRTAVELCCSNQTFGGSVESVIPLSGNGDPAHHGALPDPERPGDPGEGATGSDVQPLKIEKIAQSIAGTRRFRGA